MKIIFFFFFFFFMCKCRQITYKFNIIFSLWVILQHLHIDKIHKNKLSQSMTKQTKWHVCPAKSQISLGIHPFWSVFGVCMKKACVLSYSLSTQPRLIRMGRCPGWSESSQGAHAILLVFSCAGWISFLKQTARKINKSHAIFHIFFFNYYCFQNWFFTITF